ncbi:hypothetical protein H4J02_05085 [Protaetiibacter sp. SSC-01]|uniref:hypothetical protein n=1 Tax=Protaetiibacter sp. SSC-01 TaxID=2759943 RepID=UPI0016569C51|nr:hypothetical protein [Protaetiibacter sp. SSC-01]QNO38390.1 hypothetical protein H4J02_05085 [Protaetiibacter sp. SSC-01]
MAARTLADEARELYRLPPAEFVAARNTRRAELRASDRALSDAIGALKRASPAAWLVTMLAAEDSQLLEELVALGDELRAALENADREALTRLTDERRAALRDASEVAAAIAEEHGVNATRAVLDDVAETLQAAMGDADAAAAVRSGLLVRALEPAGFDAVDLEGAVALDADAPSVPPRPRLRVVKDPDAELARARAEADEVLEAARARHAEAEAARREHDERVDGARADRDQQADEVRRLEAELAAAKRRLDDAEAELRAIGREGPRLERELEKAGDVLARAEERRRRLDPE